MTPARAIAPWWRRLLAWWRGRRLVRYCAACGEELRHDECYDCRWREYRAAMERGQVLLDEVRERLDAEAGAIFASHVRAYERRGGRRPAPTRIPGAGAASSR